MRLTATAVLAVVAALALASPAGAKEAKSVGLCGPSFCFGVTEPREIALLAESGPVSGSPAPVGPYFALRFRVKADGHEESWEMYYVPSAGLVRADNGAGEARWAELPSPAARALLDRLAANVTPFPAPTIVGVTVDGTAVRGDASTYLGLFSLPADDGNAPHLTDWVPVDLRSAKPSPWTDGRWDLAYSRSGDALQRGTEVVSLTDGVSDDIAAAQTLADEDGGVSWTKFALVLAVIAVLAAVLLPLARKRPLPDPGPPPASEP